MNITEASETDLEYIREANDKILEHHQISDDLYQPIGNQTIQDSPKEKISLVAKCDTKLVGFISGSIKSTPDRSITYALIQAIWVEESERGKGVAQKLVTAFEEKIKTKGIMRIEVSVDIRNEQGRELWNKANYQTYQERRYKRLT